MANMVDNATVDIFRKYIYRYVCTFYYMDMPDFNLQGYTNWEISSGTGFHIGLTHWEEIPQVSIIVK